MMRLKIGGLLAGLLITTGAADPVPIRRGAPGQDSVRGGFIGNTGAGGFGGSSNVGGGSTFGGSTSSGGYGGYGGGISSTQQNGYSTWGTYNASSLPYSYGGSYTRGGSSPWGSINTQNYNPYTSAPRTGVQTRSYHLTLAECDIKPDGVVTQNAICVNGQFPGPLISANYGDTLSITVTNILKDEGTAMHWHGFLQTNNNQNDGVPGVTQCPIAPGQSYTYTMKAELYGSSWYHTHYSAQYAGGAVGPIVVYGPYNSAYDVDVGPVMLMEWYRNNYKKNVQGLMNPLAKGGPALPTANSNLINGKMRFPCSQTKLACETASYAAFNFTSGKNHRLRLMNIGSGAVQKFSIDGHTMQVIANDYMPIKPYNTSVIALGVGQRADVIVFGSGRSGDKYWMRSNIVVCSINDGVLTEALAVIYYQGADTKTLPAAAPNQGPAASTSPMSCGNDPLTSTIPTFPIAVAKPNVTQELAISLKSNGTHMLYKMNNVSFRADFNDPLINHAFDSTLRNLPAKRNIWNLGTATEARVVIYNWNDAPHPIHLHGHNMQVLALGMGKWDGTIVRASNPQRRDVQVMPPAASATVPSFLVLQWTASNPGVWPLHCHFAWHSSLGLVTNVVVRQSLMQTALRGAATAIAPVCQQWNAFTAKGPLLSGTDSGL
ncbi:hypothetical protein LTR17_000958 [Elasticomyces elasticus]|nr:hypothetical protein LTR17_000958 [Elasticomyces elasticus]